MQVYNTASYEDLEPATAGLMSPHFARKGNKQLVAITF